MSREISILWCGADPGFYTGYGKVNFELLSRLLLTKDPNTPDKYDSKNTDLFVTHYALFSLPPAAGGAPRFRKLESKNLSYVNNCVANDELGIQGFATTVKQIRPDIIFIYNGIVEIFTLVNSCREIMPPKTKVVAYLDIYYDHIRSDYINNYNAVVHSTIVFSDFQVKVCKESGMTTPIHILPHGINKEIIQRIDDKNKVKIAIGLPVTNFLVSVANKNQFRKRYDTLLQAWARFCKLWFEKYGEKYGKMIEKINEIAAFEETAEAPTPDHQIYKDFISDYTTPNGTLRYRLPVLMTICSAVAPEGWDIQELAYMYFAKEFINSSGSKLAVNHTKQQKKEVFALLNKHLIIKDTSKGKYVEDGDMNLINNATDLGICTSMAEGVGLCHLEQAYLGVPQIIGNFSGLPHTLPPPSDISKIETWRPGDIYPGINMNDGKVEIHANVSIDSKTKKEDYSVTGVFAIDAKIALVNVNNVENSMSEIYLMDPYEIADTILKLYSNPEYLEESAKNIKEYYDNNQESIDWNLHTENLNTYLRSVLDPVLVIPPLPAPSAPLPTASISEISEEVKHEEISDNLV